MTPAVPSGRMVTLFPPLSEKVYISFSTMSLVSPMEREKSSVFSMIGTRISEKPLRSNTRRAVCSMNCHLPDSSGRISLQPLIAVMAIKKPRLFMVIC